MATTYNAVEAVAPGTLRLVARSIPEPGAGQVRLRVEACGICHTDSLTIEAQWPGLSFPRVPGHETVGRIDALGPAVAGWRIGQRVGVDILRRSLAPILPTTSCNQLPEPDHFGHHHRRRLRGSNDRRSPCACLHPG